MKTTKKALSVSVLALAVCGLYLSMNASFPVERHPAAFAAEGGARISDVMVVVNGGGRTGLMGELKAAMMGSGPATAKAWKAVRAKGAVIASLATNVMAKQSPRKGDEASWKQKVAAYASLGNSVAAAAATQDLAAASKAVKTMSRACSGCHKLHKGK